MRFYTTDSTHPNSVPYVKRTHSMLISCIAASIIAGCGYVDDRTEVAAAADAANTASAEADSNSATSKSVTPRPSSGQGTATGTTGTTSASGTTGATSTTGATGTAGASTATGNSASGATASTSTIAASYPSEQKLSTKVPLSATPMPAYLTNSTDASTGSLVVKITDATAMGVAGETVLKHAYAKNQPWNADNSLLFLGNSYPGFLLDGKTFKLLRRFSQPAQARTGPRQRAQCHC